MIEACIYRTTQGWRWHAVWPERFKMAFGLASDRTLATREAFAAASRFLD